MLFDPCPDCGCTTTAVCTRTVTVRGCGSNPVPGAVVTMTSTGGIVTSGTTNSSGVVVLAHGAASGTIAATHPSGRFADFSGSFFGCTGTASQTITLTSAAGHGCCFTAVSESLYPTLRASPWPVNIDAIRITDPSGTQAFADASGLGDCPVLRVCSSRTADHVGASCAAPTVACTDGGSPSSKAVKQTVGVGSLDVVYSLRLTTMTLIHAFKEFWYSVYHPDQASGGVCLSPPTKAEAWRCPSAGCPPSYSTTGLKSYTSSSVVVNSVTPLNLTFVFDDGPGYGPVDAVEFTGSPGNYGPDAPIDGKPYALTIVVSEI